MAATAELLSALETNKKPNRVWPGRCRPNGIIVTGLRGDTYLAIAGSASGGTVNSRSARS
jgi:hypothetical protein